MTKISNWFLGTCGRSHIGLYVCSRCGYELLRSDFERNFVLSSPNLQGLLPLPVTVAAAKGQTQTDRDKNAETAKSKSKTISSTPFNDSMLEDFTKNVLLGRTFHKNSLVKKLLHLESAKEVQKSGEIDTRSNYEIKCGKCGSSLGHQTLSASGQTKLFVRKGSVDLTFRTT